MNDGEKREREVMKDVIKYYKDKDRHMIELVGELREEVKRLRERLIRAYDWAENAVNGNDSAMMDYTEYVCGDD